MPRPGLVVAVAVAVIGVGCAGTRSAEASRTAPRPEQPESAAATPGNPAESGGEAQRPPMHGGGTMQCPMEVPGTQVSAADTPEGESVTFTTSSPDAVPDLRARIHAMADRYERRQQEMQSQAGQGGAAEGGGAEAGSAGSGSAEPQQAPARRAGSRAVVEDIEGGARVDITPNDQAEVDRLRTAIRNRVAQMQETGSCAMGQGTPSQQ